MILVIAEGTKETLLGLKNGLMELLDIEKYSIFQKINSKGFDSSTDLFTIGDFFVLQSPKSVLGQRSDLN